MIDYEDHNTTHYVRRDDGESMHRLLASSSEEEVSLSHATIGVVVVTLALLFMVELMRHGVSYYLPPHHSLIIDRAI